MFRQFRKIEQGEFFVIGADPASGMGDYCAAHFLSVAKRDVPLVYHSKKMATEMTDTLFPVLERLADITERKPVIAYERANGGVFELERLAALNKAGKFDIFKMPSVGADYSQRAGGEPPAIRLGWDTNTATRPAMLSQLKEAIDKQLVVVYDQKTVEELYSFILVPTSSSWKAQAEAGAHDDLVMALAIAWQLYQLVDLPSLARTGQYQAYRARVNAVRDDEIGM